MNYQIRIISGLILFTFLFSTYPANGESGWWEKGLNILKNTSEQKESTGPTISEIGQAFKEALRIGSEKVVKQLGSMGGFNNDPAVHIPLPDGFNTVKTMLGKIGMSGIVDDLELRLNRAAEIATPKAKELFWQAIKEMTFEDVKAVYNGPEDSATKYFQEKMTPSLKQEMSPIVTDSLSQVGAIQVYENVIGQYKTLPFVPDVKADLTDHVTQKGIEGIFHYIAIEEAAIRENPAKQTTDLLRRVFGTK